MALLVRGTVLLSYLQYYVVVCVPEHLSSTPRSAASHGWLTLATVGMFEHTPQTSLPPGAELLLHCEHGCSCTTRNRMVQIQIPEPISGPSEFLGWDQGSVFRALQRIYKLTVNRGVLEGNKRGKEMRRESKQGK